MVEWVTKAFQDPEPGPGTLCVKQEHALNVTLTQLKSI